MADKDCSVNPVALESIGYYYYIFYLGMLLIGVSVDFLLTKILG